MTKSASPPNSSTSATRPAAVSSPRTSRALKTFDIMFNAHLDTVYPDGTVAQRPFRVEDGTVYGPGCADCKAGVIAIFHALKNAARKTSTVSPSPSATTPTKK